MLDALDRVALLLNILRYDKVETSPFDSLEGFEWIFGTKLHKLVHLQSVIWQDRALFRF